MTRPTSPRGASSPSTDEGSAATAPEGLLALAADLEGRAKKLLILGLDSAPPDLLFRRFAPDLPNIGRLREEGLWGDLESVVPAITVPAWASAMTGRDPGELGLYGFRHHTDHAYAPSRWVDSNDLREEAVWDTLSRQGRPVVVLGVPPAYPPRRVRGAFVSCFLTPDLRHPAFHPATLGGSLARVAPGYAADVEGYRKGDQARLLADVRAMTEERFRFLRHLVQSEPWDFAMTVEIGLDRIHHALWSTFDEEHPHYDRGGPFLHAVRDYYRLLDREIGATIAAAGDDAAVVVMSDHGAKRLVGGIALNEWLVAQGYLTLRSPPRERKPLRPEMVDWSRTAAWAEGGHVGRVFLNVRGRQPEGIVAPDEANEVLSRIEQGLLEIGDDQGRPLATSVFRPRDLYRQCRNVPPDLIVYFGGLDWRAIGSVGGGAIHLAENDTGPDHANHDPRGVFVLRLPGGARPGAENGPAQPADVGGARALRGLQGLKLIDCGPTMLRLLGAER